MGGEAHSVLIGTRLGFCRDPGGSGSEGLLTYQAENGSCEAASGAVHGAIRAEDVK